MVRGVDRAYARDAAVNGQEQRRQCLYGTVCVVCFCKGFIVSINSPENHNILPLFCISQVHNRNCRKGEKRRAIQAFRYVPEHSGGQSAAICDGCSKTMAIAMLGGIVSFMCHGAFSRAGARCGKGRRVSVNGKIQCCIKNPLTLSGDFCCLFTRAAAFLRFTIFYPFIPSPALESASPTRVRNTSRRRPDR